VWQSQGGPWPLPQKLLASSAQVFQQDIPMLQSVRERGHRHAHIETVREVFVSLTKMPCTPYV